MTSDDVRWIEQQWNLAGGAEPSVDTSWITLETVGLPHVAWPFLLAGLGVFVAAVVAVVAWLT